MLIDKMKTKINICCFQKIDILPVQNKYLRKFRGDASQGIVGQANEALIQFLNLEPSVNRKDL